MLPTGDVSVIPHPCDHPDAVPLARSRGSSTSGTAAPPAMIIRIDDMSKRSGSVSSVWSIALHIVGTPASTVTRSLATRLEHAHRIEKRPRQHLRAPNSSAVYGTPHAFA